MNNRTQDYRYPPNKTVRQERYAISIEPIFIVSDDAVYEVCDYSKSGISIISESKIKNYGDIGEAFLKIKDTLLDRIKLKFVRQENKKNIYKYSYEAFPSVPIEKIFAFLSLNTVIGEYVERTNSFNNIPEQFRLKVFQMKSNLDKFKTSLDEIEGNWDYVNYNKDTYFNSIIEYCSKFFEQELDSLYQTIIEISGDCQNDLIKTWFEFFRSEMKDFYSAPAANRFFSKPAGYAGDYEMMNMIYRNETEGKNLFDKALHRYCVNHSNAKAVRNRLDYLSSKIAFITKNSNKEKLNDSALKVQRFGVRQRT